MKKIFSNGSSSFDNQSVIKNKIYSYGSGEVLNSVRHSILPPKCLQLSIVVYFCNTRNLFISTVEYVQFLNSEQFRCPKKDCTATPSIVVWQHTFEGTLVRRNRSKYAFV